MTDGRARTPASREASVAPLYRDRSVVDDYLSARLATSWQRLLHRRQLDCLERILRERRPRAVLELAPGPARIAADLGEVVRGTMVESSAEMIELARRRLAEKGKLLQWTILEGSAFELSRLPGCFDLVYAFRFIRHFDPGERARLHAAVRGKLCPGGLLVFDVVNRPLREKLDARDRGAPAGALDIHDALYTEEEFAAEMAGQGYEVLELTPVLRRFRAQQWISGKLDDVAPALSAALVRVLERVPARHPLEWVALCRSR